MSDQLWKARGAHCFMKHSVVAGMGPNAGTQTSHWGPHEAVVPKKSIGRVFFGGEDPVLDS